MATASAAPPDPEHLRRVAWDIGQTFPPPFTGDHAVFAPIEAHLGYMHWHVRPGTVSALQAREGSDLEGAVPVARVYDVTDVIFDGTNAHGFFDIEGHGLSGKHYLPVPDAERNLLFEVGFRLPDGAFHPVVRSNAVFFDRDRPSSRFGLEGLYVGRDYQRVFPVDNVMDAPVYERLNAELSAYPRTTPLAVAVVHGGRDPATDPGGRVAGLVDDLVERLGRLSVDAFVFRPAAGHTPITTAAAAEDAGAAVARRVVDEAPAGGFHLIHAHDWEALPAARKAAAELNVPLLVSLHTVEAERTHGGPERGDVRALEGAGAEAAEAVVVPHSSTREGLTTLHGVPPARVLLIPDVFEDPVAAPPDPGEAKAAVGLAPERPMALFAGEISHAAGADLLLESIEEVAGDDPGLQFALVGEGPLKGELEARAGGAGLGSRVRFTGDLPGDQFERLLAASEFVVIPARTWQDEGLAQMALAFGRPVLATHAAHIHCIEHGRTGLLAFDNRNSIVWGIRELLGNPLKGGMVRFMARQREEHSRSLDSIAAEYALACEKALEAHHG